MMGCEGILVNDEFANSFAFRGFEVHNVETFRQVADIELALEIATSVVDLFGVNLFASYINNIHSYVFSMFSVEFQRDEVGSGVRINGYVVQAACGVWDVRSTSGIFHHKAFAFVPVVNGEFYSKQAGRLELDISFGIVMHVVASQQSVLVVENFHEVAFTQFKFLEVDIVCGSTVYTEVPSTVGLCTVVLAILTAVGDRSFGLGDKHGAGRAGRIGLEGRGVVQYKSFVGVGTIGGELNQYAVGCDGPL